MKVYRKEHTEKGPIEEKKEVKKVEKKDSKKQKDFKWSDIGTGKNFQRWKAKRKKKKVKRMVENKHMAGTNKAFKTPYTTNDKFIKSAKENKRTWGEHASEVTPESSKFRSGVSGMDVTEGGVYPKYGEKEQVARAGNTILRKKTGNKQAADDFKKAYRAARNAKKKSFMWDGRKYSTETKEEQNARLLKEKNQKRKKKAESGN